MGRKAPSRVRIAPSPLPAPARGRRLHSCIAAPVAQLDRASVYGTEGQRFESSRARSSNGVLEPDLAAVVAGPTKSGGRGCGHGWEQSPSFGPAHRGPLVPARTMVSRPSETGVDHRGDTLPGVYELRHTAISTRCIPRSR